jgi:hypothetical protein
MKDNFPGLSSNESVATQHYGKETSMSNDPVAEVPWPNQQEVIDGVVSTAEVPQDPDFFDNDFDQPDLTMGD